MIGRGILILVLLVPIVNRNQLRVRTEKRDQLAGEMVQEHTLPLLHLLPLLLLPFEFGIFGIEGWNTSQAIFEDEEIASYQYRTKELRMEIGEEVEAAEGDGNGYGGYSSMCQDQVESSCCCSKFSFDLQGQRLWQRQRGEGEGEGEGEERGKK
jgi:hypothetical protein